ncbi:hypothetical protein G6M85_21915 [Agrobacterium tumefaciens]|nr:hypothetical protein [Agrobacterium tumefaciens]NTE68259.1 hypothetical protein [Agrobacterium tumefaciens]
MPTLLMHSVPDLIAADGGLGEDGDDLADQAFRETKYPPRQCFVRQIRAFCERQSRFEPVVVWHLNVRMQLLEFRLADNLRISR